MKESIKTRIEKDGVIFFGPGVRDLLLDIRKTGSVRLASEEMGMSYSKARRILKEASLALGFELVVCRKGGEHGGQAHLTEEGEGFLDRYMEFEKDVEHYARSSFRRHFEQSR